MGMDRYAVLCRPDDPDRVVAELEAQDETYQRLVYDWMYLTNRNGWNEREAMETLDGRFQTYAFMLGGDASRRLLFTREVGTSTYYLLGIVTAAPEPQLRQKAYDETCRAHGLVNPARV